MKTRQKAQIHRARYPFDTVIPAKDFDLSFQIQKGEDGEHATVQRFMISPLNHPATGQKSELFCVMPDYVLVKQLLSWSPQKIGPVIYDLLDGYVLPHWLSWLKFWASLDNWKEEVDNDPEVVEALDQLHQALQNAEHKYYEYTNRKWEKSQPQK